MSKVCCVGDANVCPKSSCSMVLRSACSHRHSHESSTDKKHLVLSSPRKSKHSHKTDLHNGTLHLKTLESSLKELSLNSGEKTDSALKGVFYNNFEFSESAIVTETNSLNISCMKELNFSELSLSNTSIYKNHKECNSDYSSLNESDIDDSLDYSSKMSRVLRSSRDSLSSRHHYSDDDNKDEGELLIRRSRRPIERRTAILEQRTNGLNNHTPFSGRIHANRNITYSGTAVGDNLTSHKESSYSNISSVQYTLFDRFRWFLWRCIYLKLIEVLNFDSWLLSRIGKYRNCIILLLFSLLLLCGLRQHNEKIQESIFSSIQKIIEFPQIFGESIENSYSEESTYQENIIVQPNIEKPKTVEFISHDSNPSQSNEKEIKSEDVLYSTKSNQPSMEEIEEYVSHKLKLIQPSKEEIKMVVTEILSSYKNEKEDIAALSEQYKNENERLNLKLKVLEEKLGVLEKLKNCCDKQWSEEDFLALLHHHLIIAFKNVIDGDSDPKSKYHFFNEWLDSKFMSHEKLIQEISTNLKKQAAYSGNEMKHDDVMKIVEGTVFKYVDSIKRNLSELNKYSSFEMDIFSEDQIKKIVKEAIKLYDADKIGQVDYALESGGGSVIGTRCSETYVEKYGKVMIFGLPLWTESNSPRTAIQPDVQPGQCWAFKGTQGFLVIELSATIYITGITMEHIPVSLSPAGSIDSAPRNFSVWGLDSEKDSKGNLIGEYWYDINGDPLQYFAVKKPSEKLYSYVELQIHSNHGNLDYTCLYRFRVHGKRVK